MDIVHRVGRASVTDVMRELSGEPAYSTVRAQLRVLEDKGHLRHETEHLRYVYLPAVSPQKVRRSAVKHLVETFFDGSPEKAVAALLGGEGSKLSSEQLARIADMIEQARKEGGR